MATLCNANNSYTSSGSENGDNGGRIKTPTKGNIEYLKCTSYLTYKSDANTTINIEKFPDTLGTSNPYSKCTNN
jgi:hypothetical protein